MTIHPSIHKLLALAGILLLGASGTEAAQPEPAAKSTLTPLAQRLLHGKTTQCP